ncbi:acyl carrier protein [Nannochloropsis gaditana]|uniref:Acyl carrier protein n=1 Tax=Nannochloropsis gaditana TaxID=72520 RepID=W7TK08_9STRA|nr:acyl carrier protein [Nannochloropsis gaditana]
MRVLAFLALLAAPAFAFVPRMPAPVRARAGLTLRFSGEYSEKVRAIVLENMGDDAKVQDYLKANGDDTAEFAAMGFDSLDLVEFSMAVQKEFDLPDLNEEDFANLKTIKDVVTMVEANKK